MKALAPFGRRLLTVTDVQELGAYRLLRVGDSDGPEPTPGQFAMLAAAERWGGGEDERPYLPRAFSYARAGAGEVSFLLEDLGPGTHRLCDLRRGDRIWSLGPLGAGFRAPRDGRRAILVGGGAGIAPLAIWQDALLDDRNPSASAVPLDDRRPPAPGVPPDDNRLPAPAVPLDDRDQPAPTVLLGFRDGIHAAGAALLRDARVATDDGSVGHRGLVTDLLAAELGGDAHAVVYACGPAPMLEAVRALCAERAVPAQLALESGMACGFGACFGCVVPRGGGGYLRVCVDGPVIDAAELERVDAHAGAPA
jgi:NAD(P)H-flavin reductase